MPAKTAKQQRFMGLCSTEEGRKKAKGECPPKKVAKEFAHKPKVVTRPKSKRKTKSKKRK